MPTNLEKWQALIQQPANVEFFKGLFERVGISVVDAHEAFTCIHRGDKIDFEAGLDRNAVDYTVEITEAQVGRLAEHVAAGDIGLAEQYRVMRALFTPATAATLKNPIMANAFFRRLSKIEDVTHVHMISPTPNEPDCEDTYHTLIYVPGQWLVIPGLQGSPGRVFNLTMEDALIYHRRVFSALKANRWRSWMSFQRWYVGWRKQVSSTV